MDDADDNGRQKQEHDEKEAEWVRLSKAYEDAPEWRDIAKRCDAENELEGILRRIHDRNPLEESALDVMDEFIVWKDALLKEWAENQAYKYQDG